MRMSDDKEQELYSAFACRIMDLRVELNMNPNLGEPSNLDARLFRLEQEIWGDIKTALNLKD